MKPFHGEVLKGNHVFEFGLLSDLLQNKIM